jgi:tRNA(Ile)-lysidine synthetase-like protein
MEFLGECGQGWREDASNRDIAFLRNRVRHRLLPLIAQQFGEAAIEHMAELAEIARAEEEHWQRGHPEIAPQPPAVADQAKEKACFVSEKAGFVSTGFESEETGFVSGYRFSDTASSSKSNAPSGAAARKPIVSAASKSDISAAARETRQAASLPAGPLLALSLAAQRRLLRAWLKANSRDLSISFRLIEEALELAHGSAGKKMELPEGILRRGRLDLRLESKPFASPQDTGHRQAPDYEYALAVPGAVNVPELGACLEARVVDAASVPEDGRGQLLDPGRMPKEVLIRNWRAGDRYWPAHTAAAKKVKELLTERHATGAEKKLWPVAVAEGCGLVWMRGFSAPAAFRPPAGAAKAIWIREIAGMM